MRPHRAAVIALAALALSSCVRMDTHMTVYSDDTLDMTMLMAMDEAFVEAAGEGGNPFYDQFQLPETQAQLAAAEADYGFRYDITEYRENGYVGALMATDRMSLDAVREGGTAAAVDLTGNQPGTIVRDGEYFIYTVPRTSLANADALQGYDPALLARALDFTISITFPGAIVEHNAGEVSGENTIVLDFASLIDPEDDIVVKAYATDGRGLGNSSPTAVVLVIVILLLAATLATLIIIARSRRRATGAIEGEAASSVVDAE